MKGNPPSPKDANLNRNAGWNNNIAKNNRPNVNSWSDNTSISGTQERMLSLNPISDASRKHVKTGTIANSDGPTFGRGQNRKPKKNEKNYK